MWTSTSMTVMESIVLSCMGFLVVFTALAALAVIIVVFSRLMGATNARGAKPAAAPQPEKLEVPHEDCAVVLSVICEELHAAPEELQITSIRAL